MSDYVVAMVTKKTQTLFFFYINCSMIELLVFVSVAGMLFEVVLNDKEDHWEHYDTKIDHIACFISLSLIYKSEIQHKRSKYIKFGIKIRGNVTYFPFI